MSRPVTAVLLAAAVTVAVVWAGTAGAQASATGHGKPWHTCTRFATHLAGGLEDHNDHFQGAPGPSCITATSNGRRITIRTSYQPGAGVVAYDAIEFGRYPWSSNNGWGLPAPVADVVTTLRVTATCNRPGTYLNDADLWLSRTSDTGPLHHIREIIIGNCWHGYQPYCAPFTVKIGTRWWHAGACKTGPRGHKWLLIRFLARTQTGRVSLHLAGFLKFARRHHWISDAMTVDSASYAPECWQGCRGLSYSLTPGIAAPHYKAPGSAS